MLGSKPKRLRFVVGSALLVSAPLVVGCEDAEPPNVNTAYIEPPPNPVGEQPATVEGAGVPLPRTEHEPVPVGANGGALREGLTEQDQAEIDRRLLEALGGIEVEGRANPVPENTPPPEPVEPTLMISANPVAHPEPPPERVPHRIAPNAVAEPEPPPEETPRRRFAPNPGPTREDPPID
ncbi:MAG: hypothetical protein H6721_00360 [Sandaracinus sp.]|nr:hypothetical protein [Sandaracinus sp.]MCB9614956.1 hypothetical protein [Sandaracinus sp.]MCB9618553.1 hypothetical protein [Sandaracinus sp.]MCB9622115.1 hypothetical protein [Sandaracinus sp.]MCB9630595.1 hypothetical protein [Sandaracinus sp.]